MHATIPTAPAKVDCLVLGGGITGAGMARDAAMRGLRTLLVDSHDFASGTSHLTSKLIHGGLRYLDQGKIRLAAEGVMERDRLLNRLAPNLVRPMKFIIPYEGRKFPKWLFTVVGIQTYGFIEFYRSGRGCLPLFAPQLRRDYPGLLQHPFGVSYWDAQTNDARLVMAVLRTAQSHGAVTLNHTRLESARLDGDEWRIELSREDVRFSVRAKTLINATGPWSPDTAKQLGLEPAELWWVKGSHLLVARSPKFGDDAIIIRSVRDNRPLWVIPWETRLIVGSTERRFRGDLREVHPDADEVEDLWSSLLHFFPGHGFTRSDLRGAYAGVRPIVPQEEDSENRLSRRHEIRVDREHRMVTIHGGKLTTFRRMAEETVDALQDLLGAAPPSSELRSRLRKEMLWPVMDRKEAGQLVDELAQIPSQCSVGVHPRRRAAHEGRRYTNSGTALDSDSIPFLSGAPESTGSKLAVAPREVVDHLVRIYGRDARAIVEEARRREGWSVPLFEGLPYCLAELDYLCRIEQVSHLTDLVKRRTSVYFLADQAGLPSWPTIVEQLVPTLGWDRRRREAELAEVDREFRADCAALNDTTLPTFRPEPISV